MIVLRPVTVPTEGVRIIQPQVVAYSDDSSLGDGTLTIAESCVAWVSRGSPNGFSLNYKSIVVHAVSTDTSSFPHECLFVVIDSARSAPRRRRIPLFASEDESISEVELAEPTMEDDEEASEGEQSNFIVRFVPADPACLNTLYEEMSSCQELNPEDDQEYSDDDEEEGMNGPAIVGGPGGDMGPGWFTADTRPEDIALSEEGHANLMRMLGRNGGQNGHEGEEGHEDEDAGMEE